jgi:hypothetical protein
MSLDIQDLADLVRLLRDHAEWREPLRSLLFTEDLLALPQRFERLVALVGENFSLQQETLTVVRQLVVLQERNEESIRQLVEAQQRTEERLTALAEAQQRTEERLTALTEAQQRTEERLTALAEAQQRTEERLTALTEAQQRTEERLTALAEAQQRTEERLTALAEAQQRTEEHLQHTEERLQRLEAQMQRLTEAQQHTEERLAALTQAQQHTEEQLRQLTEQVRMLVTWQRGEAGRRDGERYEREILRRSPFLFVGGEGGTTDQPEVRRRLVKTLGGLLASEFPAEEDPFLADLVWWKGEQLVVVEASLQINGSDVRRAVQRAATLRQAGAPVTAVVVGEEWAAPDTRERARALGVEWKVGADLSPGLLAFRQLPSEEMAQAN